MDTILLHSIMMHNMYDFIVAEWDEADLIELHKKSKPLKLDNKPINTAEGERQLRELLRGIRNKE